MILNGQEIKRRGANKKYGAKLDNLDDLYTELKSKSIAQLSKEWDIPYNSIRWMTQYFPEDWKTQIVRERKRK